MSIKITAGKYRQNHTSSKLTRVESSIIGDESETASNMSEGRGNRDAGTDVDRSNNLDIQLSSFHNSFTKMENEDPNNKIVIETKKSAIWDNVSNNWTYLLMVTLICGFSTMSLGSALIGSDVPFLDPRFIILPGWSQSDLLIPS